MALPVIESAPLSTLPVIVFVPGIPQPAGSKKGFVVKSKATGKMRAVIVDDAKRSRPWKAQISAIVQDGWKGIPADEPLSMTLRFVMPRPDSHFGMKRGEKYLKESAPTWHTIKPDATKLVRAVEDALTGILWRDDAIIAVQLVTKVYGDRPGVQIRIAPAPEPEIVS